MSKIIMVDGVLCTSTPELQHWHRRASKGVPGANSEPQEEIWIDLIDRRSDYQVLEELDEIPE